MPEGKRPWEIWPEDYHPDFYFRIRRKGLEGKRQSTGTSDWREAVRRARVEWDIADAAKWDRRAAGLAALSGKRKCCLLGEIFAAYRSGPAIVDEPARIVQSCRLVVAMARGWWLEGGQITEHGELARRIDALPGDVLSRELVRDYLTAAQGGTFRPMARERENVTINKRLRMARQLFSRRAVDLCYEGLGLPDLEGWMKFPALPEPAIDLEEEMIGVEDYLAMLDAADGLESGDAGEREIALVNRLARELGLRNSEILAARGDWLWMDPRSGQWYLDVRDRPEQGFRMKGVMPGRLPLSPELLAVLQSRAAADAGAWLVLPGALPTRRWDLVQRDHNAWLKGIIGEIRSGKGAHRLRKYVATMIAVEEGIAVASQYLRHASEVVSLKNYIARMKESLPVISDARLRRGIKAWQGA